MTGSPAAEPPPWRHPVVGLLVETTVLLVLLTSAYAMVPLRLHEGGPPLAVRLLVSVLSLAGLGALARTHLRHSRRVLDPERLRLEYLLALLYLLVVVFALAYLVLERFAPGRLTGVDGRVAALYLSATVVSTVGMGDVHPTGTGGQVVVTVQMLVDVIYLGTAVRLLSLGRGPGS